MKRTRRKFLSVSKLYHSRMTSKRKAIKIFYDMYEPIRLRDIGSLHEHHDIFVVKYKAGII